MTSPCQIIAATMGSLFTCHPVKDYVRIRTPFLYPDGDVIDLFFREDKNGLLLTDLGESLRWLRMNSVAEDKTYRQKQLIEDVRITHGVTLGHGELLLVVSTLPELSEAVARLSQACARTADVWFTSRTRLMPTTIEEVADFLVGRGIQFTQNAEYVGKSGRKRIVDLEVVAPHHNSLVQVLATGSKAATKSKAEHALAVWFDLSGVKEARQNKSFITLFDDTADVWSPEDVSLLAEVSLLSFWSKPEEFERQLRDVA